LIQKVTFEVRVVPSKGLDVSSGLLGTNLKRLEPFLEIKIDADKHENIFFKTLEVICQVSLRPSSFV